MSTILVAILRMASPVLVCFRCYGEPLMMWLNLAQLEEDNCGFVQEFAVLFDIEATRTVYTDWSREALDQIVNYWALGQWLVGMTATTGFELMSLASNGIIDNQDPKLWKAILQNTQAVMATMITVDNAVDMLDKAIQVDADFLIQSTLHVIGLHIDHLTQNLFTLSMRGQEVLHQYLNPSND
ncbi:hypothetical protein HDE_08272 [Halotydeus destructor]|nr:hypothetical protein HDE_08272 [Halotydeus destructor]